MLGDLPCQVSEPLESLRRWFAPLADFPFQPLELVPDLGQLALQRPGLGRFAFLLGFLSQLAQLSHQRFHALAEFFTLGLDSLARFIHAAFGRFAWPITFAWPIGLGPLVAFAWPVGFWPFLALARSVGFSWLFPLSEQDQIGG